MGLFKKNLLVFFRVRRVFFVALLLLLGLVAYMCYRCYTYTLNWDVMLNLDSVQLHCFTFFVVSLYISYEYMHIAGHNGIEECAASHKYGKARLYGSAFCVLAAFSFLLFFIPTAFNFGVTMAGGMTDLSYYGHILLVNFLNVFLLCLLASLLGACLALRLKRIPAYAIMALVIFILSPMSDMLPGAASDTSHINFWPAKWVFSKVLPQNTTWMLDYQYGFSNEALRWNLTFFWLCLLLAFILPAVLKKKSRARLAAIMLALVLAGANLFGYCMGGSEMKLGPYPDSISRGDYEYYRDHAQKEQPADFTVTAYDMKLDIRRELNALVTMQLDSAQPLNSCNFTLYRGYKVSAVTDKNGNRLSYTRDSDYITVTGQALSTVVMRYHGFSPILYSNSQAALLPGCFPYYPMAGFHRMNDGGQGYIPVTNGFSSKFTVYAGGGKPFYCNLPKAGEQANTFAGESTCLTLMRGFFSETEADGYRFCSFSVGGYGTRPIDLAYIKQLQKKINQQEKKQGLAKHLELTEKKIFQTAVTFSGWAGFGPVADLGDHMIIWADNIDYMDDLAKRLVKEYNHA